MAKRGGIAVSKELKTVLNILSATLIILAVCTFFMPDQIVVRYIPDGDLHYFSRYWIFLLTPAPLLAYRRWSKRKKSEG
jgi:hypothetical protein